jgi:hypothetical protein
MAPGAAVRVARLLDYRNPSQPEVNVTSVEDAIKNEARLFALESIVCQNLAAAYRALPREIFDVVKQQAMQSVRTQTFPGFDAAYSDVISAEFEAAVERLYSMIQHHLDTLERRRQI